MKPHERQIPQHVMPPHEILDAMYQNPELFQKIFKGNEGSLSHYWSYNQELAKQVVWPGDAPWLRI